MSSIVSSQNLSFKNVELRGQIRDLMSSIVASRGVNFKYLSSKRFAPRYVT